MKTFPIVWAVRKKEGHTGIFSDDKKVTLYWASNKEKVEVKEFNIVEDWQGVCAFFDGWKSIDCTRANKTRECIFTRNNYDSAVGIILPPDKMFFFPFSFLPSIYKECQ